MKTTRRHVPDVWITWLAKLLGGHRCHWSMWFRAHYRYPKYELESGNLSSWSRDHDRWLKQRVADLRKAGYDVSVEAENEIKITGRSGATLTGKPDIVARKPGEVLVVDGKTGKERDSDKWQITIYEWVMRQIGVTEPIEGVLDYTATREQVSLPASDMLTEPRVLALLDGLQTIAGDTPPVKVPGADECRFCNIGPGDCPDRWDPMKQRQTATTTAF